MLLGNGSKLHVGASWGLMPGRFGARCEEGDSCLLQCGCSAAVQILPREGPQTADAFSSLARRRSPALRARSPPSGRRQRLRESICSLLGDELLQKGLGLSADSAAIVLLGVRVFRAVLEAAIAAVDKDELIICNDQPAVGTLINVERDGRIHHITPVVSGRAPLQTGCAKPASSSQLVSTMPIVRV